MAVEHTGGLRKSRSCFPSFLINAGPVLLFLLFLSKKESIKESRSSIRKKSINIHVQVSMSSVKKSDKVRMSKSLTATTHDRHVNVIRDANAHAMTVKGRKMWCVIWCDRGWRIRMPVLL